MPNTADIAAQAAWLVTNGPDGRCSKVVVGFEDLRREVVAAVFGDPDDASDEAQAMRDRLDEPSEWDGDRWSIDWSFEDGYLNVQRVTHLPRILAAIEPQAGAEPVGEVVNLTGSLNDMAVIQWVSGFQPIPGAKLYTSPVTASDERAVQALTVEITGLFRAFLHGANGSKSTEPFNVATCCRVFSDEVRAALSAALAAAPKAQPVQDIASEKAAGALERAKATLELYHRGGLGDEHFYADLTVTDALCIVKAALAAAPQEQLAQAEPAKVTYRNWRGETAERQIIPQRIWYGSTEWHPESQWLITAVDVKKGVERDFALSGFSQPVQGWQTESGIERRARARDWLRNRWSEPHPNEGHVKQLADYAAFLAAAPLPAGPSSKETANGGIDAMVEAAARVITANEYGLAEGEPDHNRDDWVSENWPKRADYAREILTAAGHINPAKGDQ